MWGELRPNAGFRLLRGGHSLGISHNLCRTVAIELMVRLHDDGQFQAVIVTNSILQAHAFTERPFTSVTCLSDTLTPVVNRIHDNRSVTDPPGGGALQSATSAAGGTQLH